MSQQLESELLALPYRELQARAKDAGLKASGCAGASCFRAGCCGRPPRAAVHLAPQQLGGQAAAPAGPLARLNGAS